MSGSESGEVATLGRQLQAFLRQASGRGVEPEIRGLRRSAEGASRENWPFDAVWGASSDVNTQRLILRRDQAVALSHMDRLLEFQIMESLHASAPFPVPRPLHLELGSEWLGRPFMILERAPGCADRRVLSDSTLDVETRIAIAKRYARIAGELHALDADELEVDFVDRPNSGADAATQAIERWVRPVLDDPIPSPVATLAMRWLELHHPSDGPVALIHGDLRPGNLLVLDGEVTAVLDWETACLSDPAEDLGWITLPTNYRTEHFVETGFEFNEFLTEYQRAGGCQIDPDRIQFWRVISAFKAWYYSVTRIRNSSELGLTVGAAAGRLRSWHVWYERLLMELID